jgi:hypothetical protein
MSLSVPLCVYDPGEPEDKASAAFGFGGFASVPLSRVADVCHVASHLRFATPGDVLLSNDSHFDKARLANIGVNCMSPTEFMDDIDPTGVVLPVRMP